jgi:hypothetical protein
MSDQHGFTSRNAFMMLVVDPWKGSLYSTTGLVMLFRILCFRVELNAVRVAPYVTGNRKTGLTPQCVMGRCWNQSRMRLALCR